MSIQHNPSPLRISPNPREFLLPQLVSGLCVDLVNTRLIYWERDHLVCPEWGWSWHDAMHSHQPIRGQDGGWLTNGRPVLSAAAASVTRVTAEAGIQQLLPLATDCSLTLCAASNAATTTTSMKCSHWITGGLALLLLISIGSGWSLYIILCATKPCLDIWYHHSFILSVDTSDLCQGFLSTAPMTMTMTPTMLMRSMEMMAMMMWREGWSCRTITPSWTPGARG